MGKNKTIYYKTQYIENDSSENKKDSLDAGGKKQKRFTHKTQYIENNSTENKKDSLDKLVGKNKNDLLHEPLNLGKYICLKCKYITSICSNYYRHIRTKKHLNNEKNISEKTYECINCKFKSKYKSNYKRHLKSKKHLSVISNSNKPLNFSEFIKLINIEMNDIESIITWSSKIYSK